MLQFVGDNSRQFTTQYGNISTASIGAIQRGLLEIEQQGGNQFFGEPMLDIDDLLQTDGKGHGMVNVLSAEELIRSPKLDSTFLLWMLSELFERLPEVGDPDKPTLVFFFDEAHLLFDDVAPALVDKIEQVVRLIRSKGVGVYFVTQSPSDIPERPGSAWQPGTACAPGFHAARSEGGESRGSELCTNPAIDTERVITELAVGEALVSLSMRKEVQESWSGRGCFHPRRRSARLQTVSVTGIASRLRRCTDTTIRPSIASPPTRS